ncbi:MAG: glycoside hydrolase family 15 protein, partial [Polyangiaceae bacterium]
YDAQLSKIDLFLEHPYQSPSAGVATRNFAYDSYPGIRVGGAAAWNNALTATTVELLTGTGIVHVVRTFQGLTIDEYHFAPMGLAEAASVMLVKVTRTSGTGNVDAFALFNYHLGSAVSGTNVPGTDGENVAFDSPNDAFYEYGPSGAAFGYGSIGATSTHRSTSAVFNTVSGGGDLNDTSSAAGSDLVPGFQASLGNLAVGASAWAGWFTVDDHSADAEAAISRVRTWLASRTPAQVLSGEQTAWASWITPPPAGASALEASLAKQAQAEIRMAQVNEAGTPNGQILAAIAPGMWNISWVRDMAYATVALAKTGHYAEAKRALAFQMSATVGTYQTEVGVPYQISVVRYFGNGTEESDTNADGPNIEFDGFGLFLWSLSEYVAASNDTATLNAWWPTIQAKVADVLVHLQEPNGLIAADSSIWEVHWNGQQKHFAYTTITAANGLCAAAHMATLLGNSAAHDKYLAAGQKARDAILASLRAPDGTIGQSTETLAAKTSWLDAAAIEALNFGLVDPKKHSATATLSSMKRGLVPPSGQGFMRNDDGAYYDSQEWVFVDFRSERALELNGDPLS